MYGLQPFFLIFASFLLLSASESIEIWRIFPSIQRPRRTNATREVQGAQRQFARAMGPERMADLWEVRKDLAEMGQRLVGSWEAEGLMEPSAVLAQAMVVAQERESNPERIGPVRSLSRLNGPIQEFLFQGDILLDSNQSRQMLANLERPPSITILAEEEEAEEKRRRRRRQAQTGRNFPRNQWDPGRPISFVFDPKLAESTRRLVRLATQFWTENSCLSFAENGAGTPRVKFFPGGGCYSQVGRAFHQQEQLISLGRGCEQFGIAAHEIGHTLGFFHGQARFDRDQFVNVVYSNLSPQMAGQFVKQTPEDNFNFGITYDYGSIMHYSDTDVATNRVTMLAKERIYQHTMGNNVKPSFLDVLEMNLYYKCSEHCNAAGADCKNGGYRHPRDCNRCMCPDGFGAFDCSDRAPPVFGAPPDCGATLEAMEGPLQTLNGSVTAMAEKMADRHAQCWWHIRAPSGKRVQLRVKSVSGACSDGCFYGGIELKTREFLRVGARVCCRTDLRTLGLLYSSSELAMVSVFSQFKTQRFSIEFRAVDPSIVPRSGVGDYDELEGARESAREESGKEKEKGTAKGECRDVAGNCFRLCRFWRKLCHPGRTNNPRPISLLRLCDNALYRGLMGRQCARSCMRCSGAEGGGSEEGERNGGEAGEEAGKRGGGANCPGGKDHESCHTWANNGFCQSKSYSLQIKRQICPRECQLC